MGSMSNPNPWAPYDSYNDCSHGICNIYCPQWCYILFPPPPPPSFFQDSSSNNNFSPLLIALIGVLTFALILISYYTLISKYCNRRRNDSSSSDRLFSFVGNNGVVNAVANGGLNQSLINSITVYKYKKGDGFVDGSDCSVCLSEFQENENLRLLPKCNHAFHLPCIDTWLKSHSNCPLCRAFVTGIAPPVIATQSSSVHQIDTESGENDAGIAENDAGIAENDSNTTDYQYETTDSVIVIPDLETRSRNEFVTNINDTRSNPKPEEQRDSRDEEEEPQQIRRSVSLNSVIMVSIADIVEEFGDNKRDEESGSSERREGGDGEDSDGKTIPLTENERNGVSSFLVRSSMAMKRSVSTGRFILPRYERGGNYRLPN